MKKMNNILKMISKMESNANEVKLGKHEVELGALQEIEKDLIAASSGAIKSIDMAKAAIKPAQTSLQLNKELLVKLQNFTKQIRDLGILAPQKEVETGITQVKENIQAIQNLITNLQSI
jgi:hypothetical protein